MWAFTAYCIIALIICRYLNSKSNHVYLFFLFSYVAGKILGVDDIISTDEIFKLSGGTVSKIFGNVICVVMFKSSFAVVFNGNVIEESVSNSVFDDWCNVIADDDVAEKTEESTFPQVVFVGNKITEVVLFNWAVSVLLIIALPVLFILSDCQLLTVAAVIEDSVASVLMGNRPLNEFWLYDDVWAADKVMFLIVKLTALLTAIETQNYERW